MAEPKVVTASYTAYKEAMREAYPPGNPWGVTGPVDYKTWAKWIAIR